MELKLPKFIDKFIDELRKKGLEMKKKLEEGKTSILDNDYKAKFLKNWLELPDERKLDCNIVAVDGSRGLREFVNGYRFYIVRALGINNFNQEPYRFLETNVVNLIGGEIHTFMDIKTEYAEFSLILDALKNIDEKLIPSLVILLDGSLYGRMLHLIKDTDVEEERDLLLRYMRLFSDIMEICREKKILFIGVSKDSFASFFRNELLDQIKDEELKELKKLLNLTEVMVLKNCVDIIDRDPTQSFENFYKLEKLYPGKLDRFKEILKEYRSKRTDHQIIMRWRNRSGFTTPMELGPARRGPISHIERIKSDKRQFIKTQFRQSLLDHEKDKSQFMKKAIKVLDKVLQFPTVVSFHILLDNNDSPMRIDFPSWFIGSSNKIEVFHKTEILKEDDIVYSKIKEVINILQCCYGGLRNYNLYLKKVDEDVKLKHKSIDRIYEKILEKELKVLLHHTRDYRRVSIL